MAHQACWRRLWHCGGWVMVLSCSLLVAEAWEGLAQGKAYRGEKGEKPRVLRGGAAASNITPPLDEPIVGGWSAPLSRDVHDELHARCLVLDDGKTRLVFVVCDNLGIAREAGHPRDFPSET